MGEPRASERIEATHRDSLRRRERLGLAGGGPVTPTAAPAPPVPPTTPRSSFVPVAAASPSPGIGQPQAGQPPPTLALRLAIALAALTGLAGVLHCVAAPGHAAHAPAHGLFLFALGAVQILLAVVLLRRRDAWNYAFAGLVLGMSLSLWAITRFARAPFSQEAEGAGTLDAILKAVELAGLALAAFLFARAATRRPGWRLGAAATAGLLVVASLALGAVVYEGAVAAEPLLPDLKEEEGHHHGGGNHSHGATDDAQPSPTPAHGHPAAHGSS